MVGQVTEFPVAQGFPGTPPGFPGNAMARGSDGNVWFSTNNPVTIGRITPAGQVTQFADPTAGATLAGDFTLGSDGNLWFTSNTFVGRGTVSNGFIGRVTTAGQISEFGTPTAVSFPADITLGSDGNIWFNEDAAHAVGRILTH